VAVEFGRRVPERGGGADDRDPRLVAARKLDEAREDDPLAQLVFGGPPSVVGASRCGAEASVIHDSVLAAVLRRREFFCEFLYACCHIVRRPVFASGSPQIGADVSTIQES